MKISILGTGSFGTAIAQILTDNNHEVLMWTVDSKNVDEINNKKTNKYYYENFIFEDKVKATTDLEELVNYSDYIVIALPSKFIKDTMKKINKILKNKNIKKTFINMSKGMDYKNLITISDIIEENIDSKYIKKLCSMTGPSFAKEIVERKITKFTLASHSGDNLDDIKNIFQNDYILINHSKDMRGIEILSSVKNIIALAAGIIHGLGYKDNTHAIIIAEGIKEMMKLCPFYDIDTNTILSVSGVGDLVLTASSKTSRNYSTGEKVGMGMSVSDAIDTTKTVVEGVECAKVMYKFSKEHKIDLPITKAVYNIFYKGKDPKEEIIKVLR